MCVVSWALHLGWVKRSKGNGGLGEFRTGRRVEPFFLRGLSMIGKWSVENFIGMLWDKKVGPAKEDKLAGKASKDGLYSVRYNLDLLEGVRETGTFPKKLVWNQVIPTKVGFFVWEAWWEKAMTLDQNKSRFLSRQQILFVKR